MIKVELFQWRYYDLNQMMEQRQQFVNIFQSLLSNWINNDDDDHYYYYYINNNKNSKGYQDDKEQLQIPFKSALMQRLINDRA